MSYRKLKIALVTLLGVAVSSISALGLADGAAKFLGNIPVDGEVPSDFAKYWNQITPEYECLWVQIEKKRGEYDFSKCDANLYAYRQGIYQAGTQAVPPERKTHFVM